MASAPTPLDVFELIRFAATIVTPFAVLWLGIRSASRKRLMETIDAKIEKLGQQVEAGKEECREDINAVTVQVAAFQREVAERYPLRRELEDGFKSLREDIRYLYNKGGQIDPYRR